MFIVKYRKIFFTISLLLVGVSLFFIANWGLDFGLDFTGGSILEITYETKRPEILRIEEALGKMPELKAIVQASDDLGLVIRTVDLTQKRKAELEQALTINQEYKFTQDRFSSIGPVLGEELARKGMIAIGLSIILIILFVAFSFRGVSKPVSSWKYGLVAVVTLCHDIIIPVGVMAVISHYTVAEIDALFLTALLAIMGLSINDTIVIFDRIRENLRHKISPHFDEVVGMSLSQTFARSINTSLTAIIVLLSLLFLGGESTRYFALAMSVGMIVGTYSSIFIAAPLLVTWDKWSKRV